MKVEMHLIFLFYDILYAILIIRFSSYTFMFFLTEIRFHYILALSTTLEVLTFIPRYEVFIFLLVQQIKLKSLISYISEFIAWAIRYEIVDDTSYDGFLNCNLFLSLYKI